MRSNEFRSSIVVGGLLGAAMMIVAGCGAAPDQEDFANDGSTRGELLVYSIDQMEGQSETQFFLRTADNVEHRLFFDVEPELAPGTRVKVWGPREGDGLRVTSLQAIEPPVLEKVTSALTNGPAYPARTFAFVMVDTGTGVNTTKDEVLNLLLNNPGSVKSYYKYASYGRQDISVEVFGPIKYTMTGCGTSKLTTDLRPMIPGTFQHYLWYLGGRNASCGWAGLASVGTPDRPSKDTWYNASTGCVVLVQEPGHNFGMAHSSSMTCGGQTFVDNPMGVCMHSEYGDRFDPMGGGCRHMNAWQKAYQGWYGACNGVKVASSGTFTLLPNGRACNGAQFLQIPAPKVRMMPRSGGGGSATVDMLTHYYIEFRAPDNFDGTLGWRNMPQAALAPQVQVRIGGDLHERTQRGLHTWLLDMTPATASNSDAGLLVGKTYTDPAGGLSVTVMAIDANQATVKVDIMGGAATGPTCIDGTPFTAPGPGPESCTAIPVDGAGGMGGAVGGTGGVSGAGGAGGRGGAGGGRMDGGTPLPGSGGGMGTGGELGGLMPPDGAVADVGGAVTGSGGSTGADGAAMAPRSTGGEAISGCGCETAPGGGVPTAFGTLGIALALGAARRRRPG